MLLTISSGRPKSTSNTVHAERPPAQRACTKNLCPPGPLFKILPAVLTSFRHLEHKHNRKSHPQYRSTNSDIHLSNPARDSRVMAQTRLDVRSTWVSGRGATFRSIRRTDAGAAVESGDDSGRGCCSCCSFRWRFCAGGSRGRVAGDGELGGVIRFTVSIDQLLEASTRED